MNFAELPTWFWIGAAVVAYIVANKKGWLKTDPAAKPNAVAPNTSPPAAAQIVEIRHTTSSGQPVDESADQALTETRRVGFEFDVAVKPVAKPKGSSPP